MKMKVVLSILHIAFSCMQTDLIEQQDAIRAEISIDTPMVDENTEIIQANEGDIEQDPEIIHKLEGRQQRPSLSHNFAFHFIETLMDWNNATEYCNSLGMSLAYFDNESEFNLYLHQSRIVTGSVQQRWIDGTSQGRALKDFSYKGNFTAPWGKYEPTGYTGEECIALYTTLGWEKEVANDIHCERKHPFACRKNFV